MKIYKILLINIFQDELYNELNEVFGDDSRPIYQHDLSRFKYLDQVVKETQRRFTIIKEIFREVEEDIIIGEIGCSFNKIIQLLVKMHADYIISIFIDIRFHNGAKKSGYYDTNNRYTHGCQHISQSRKFQSRKF